MCIALCRIVAHNIAQNRPDNFPSYPPHNHHCSDDVYLRGAKEIFFHHCLFVSECDLATLSKDFGIDLPRVGPGAVSKWVSV